MACLYVFVMYFKWIEHGLNMDCIWIECGLNVDGYWIYRGLQTIKIT